MNDDGILLLSTVMEVLTFISIVVALVVVWFTMRARRAARLKESRTPRSRLSGLDEDRSRK